MDIANIKPIERTMEIVNPGTGAPLGVRVSIMSIDDDRLKRIKREITDERLKLDQKGKAPKSDDIERNGERLLFAATTGWEWYNPTGKEGGKDYDKDAMPSFNGEVPDYNPKNFYDIIRSLPWFADQIRDEIDETKAFFDNSKTI